MGDWGEVPPLKLTVLHRDLRIPIKDWYKGEHRKDSGDMGGERADLKVLRKVSVSSKNTLKPPQAETRNPHTLKPDAALNLVRCKPRKP